MAGGFYARLPDVPGALPLLEAQDALGVALAELMRRQSEIPLPSKAKRGQRVISVPLYLAPKIALHAAVRESKVSQEYRCLCLSVYN